jgi:hypothetical protein
MLCQPAAVATILIPSDQANNVYYCGGILSPSTAIAMTQSGAVRRKLLVLTV